MTLLNCSAAISAWFLGRLRSVLQSSLLQFALSDCLCVGTELLLDAFDSVMFFDSAKQFVEVC